MDHTDNSWSIVLTAKIKRQFVLSDCTSGEEVGTYQNGRTSFQNITNDADENDIVQWDKQDEEVDLFDVVDDANAAAYLSEDVRGLHTTFDEELSDEHELTFSTESVY